MEIDLLSSEDKERISLVMRKARLRTILKSPLLRIGVFFPALFLFLAVIVGGLLSFLVLLWTVLFVSYELSKLKGRGRSLISYVQWEPISNKELKLLEQGMSPVHFDRIHRIRANSEDRTLRIVHLEKLLIADRELYRVQNKNVRSVRLHTLNGGSTSLF